jgi:hypothetical protein
MDGIVAGTTPQEVSEIVKIIQPERTRQTPFDIVIRYDLADPVPNSSEAIAAWEAVGVTWCRCRLRVSFDQLSEARKFLRAGPPGNTETK